MQSNQPIVSAVGVSTIFEKARLVSIASSLLRLSFMQKSALERNEILVVVAKGEDSALHDFCCKVADTYSYNVSVFVVDNSDPDTALEELEKLTSYTHFRLVILGPTLDWAVKGALRQAIKEAGLNTATRVITGRDEKYTEHVWSALDLQALHQVSPSRVCAAA